MKIEGAFVFVVSILLWTAVREVLLDKFWRYQHGTHLAQYGNLYVVFGCMVANIALVIAILGE
jgi:uncharacterized membrane protein